MTLWCNSYRKIFTFRNPNARICCRTFCTTNRVLNKIAIIGGAGSVGSTVAYSLLTRKIAPEITLVDIDQEKCEGTIIS